MRSLSTTLRWAVSSHVSGGAAPDFSPPICRWSFQFSRYNRLGSDAEESDVEQIIEMAGKASVADQQNQVQENVHSQIKSFCSFMDEILLQDVNKKNVVPLPASGPAQQRSGLSLAVGKSGSPTRHPVRRTGRGEDEEVWFWFKLGSGGSNTPILKTIVPVTTRALGNEELLLNYRSSNLKKRPAWYTPVNEEEDRRRWS